MRFLSQGAYLAVTCLFLGLAAACGPSEGAVQLTFGWSDAPPADVEALTAVVRVEERRDDPTQPGRVLAETDPGQLSEGLRAFQSAQVNLTKIESRPAKVGRLFRQQFFIDFEGHKDDPTVVELLNTYADQIKWLGSYVMLC